MDDLSDNIARLRSTWMAGGLAQKHCPADWAPIIGAGPAAELALAALAGQALQTAFRPHPGAALATRENLPALPLPPAPDALRPRLRRLLATQRALLHPLLIFLAARGVSMHPADWMPAKREDRLPSLYAPWSAWMNNGDKASAGRPARKPAPPDPALAAELAAMLSVETLGVLRRQKRIAVPKLKTGPQNARRRELFGIVAFPALAAALGVPEADLLTCAPTGVDAGIGEFTGLVAATGTPAQQRALFTAIIEDKHCPLAAARVLAPSLTRAESAALLPAVLQREESPGFELTIELANEALGESSFAELARAPGFAAMRSLTMDTEAKPENVKLAFGLTAIGLLAAPAAARSIIDLYVAAGVSSADPKLTMLTLNIALTQEPAT